MSIKARGSRIADRGTGTAIGATLWTVAKGGSVAAAVTVVALLLIAPDIGLFVTWKLLVPLVPLLLLVAPEVWRNLCPIAVVHQLPVSLGLGGERRFPARVQRVAPAIAALLFFAIVPLRLTVFNSNGTALAIFVLSILVIALAGGLLFFGKSGWCVTWCPVLPVERLYGQRPVMQVEHAHCSTCSGCIRSCYDLKPERSLEELIDPDGLLPNRSQGLGASLLRTPTGLFAMGFPGFVPGYFTHPAGLGIGPTYLRLAAFVAGSIMLLALTERAYRVNPRTLVKWAAAIGAFGYYWFTIPDVAKAAHELLDIPPVPDLGITAARIAFFAIATGWLMAAVNSSPRTETVSRRQRAGSEGTSH
ncbi:MAG: hypothetical protein WEE89_17180 [Gemmatimonadota bacterium]